MDNYQGYKDFITCYERENDQSVVVKYADQTETTIINSSHNIDVIERRLYNQHQTIQGNVLPTLQKQMRDCRYAILNFVVFAGIELALDMPMSAVSSVGVMTYFVYQWAKRHKQVSRLQLTDYCLKNANSIQLVKTNPNVSLKLSESGEKAFEMDHGFSLNYAHLYTNKNLKQFKKVIKK